MTRAFWTSAFLDLAPGDLQRGSAFWASVTGYDATEVADLAREFPPLRPNCGAPYLFVQRAGNGTSRVHLDLHVEDLDAALDQARSLGARLVDRRDHAVLRSPGGFAFCLVTDPVGEVPSPAVWPDGSTSRVDCVRLFVPWSDYPEELALWEAMQPFRPVGLGLAVERGDEPGPRVVLEVGSSDRQLETVRHVALGAEVVDTAAKYDDAVDPVGIRYRIADRSH